MREESFKKLKYLYDIYREWVWWHRLYRLNMKNIHFHLVCDCCVCNILYVRWERRKKSRFEKKIRRRGGDYNSNMDSLTTNTWKLGKYIFPRVFYSLTALWSWIEAMMIMKKSVNIVGSSHSSKLFTLLRYIERRKIVGGN